MGSITDGAIAFGDAMRKKRKKNLGFPDDKVDDGSDYGSSGSITSGGKALGKALKELIKKRKAKKTKEM